MLAVVLSLASLFSPNVSSSTTDEDIVIACARTTDGKWVNYFSYDEVFRQRVLNCIGRNIAYRIESEQLDTKWCALKIGQNEKYAQCKLFNNSLESLKSVVTYDLQLRKNQDRLLRENTKEKRDENAGWQYGSDNGIREKADCYLSNVSSDFIYGCEQSIIDGRFDPFD